MFLDDTIAAIATAPGEAGIGIVRISGEESIEIIDKIFESKRGKKLSQYKSRRITYGYIIDPETNEKIDEVLVSYMKAPDTYTREDIVEINCHGGMMPVKRILELVLRSGARAADPGEFTKRAFLNGRIDLVQAEAIMDLIGAKTEKGFDVALNQLEGFLSKEVSKIREKLLEMLAHIEVSIDFAEEDVDEITLDILLESSEEVKKDIQKLLDTSHTGKIIREGLSTVIVGKPNVGKSSLLNALIRESRAIVTNVPGTTRDVIEEYLSIKGIPLRLIDTAGIRETDNVVEKIGVERSKELFNLADLIIVVLDASDNLTKEDLEIMNLIGSKRALIIINKTDLPQKLDVDEVRNIAKDKDIIEISITENIGIEQIEDTLAEMVYQGAVRAKDSLLVTNIRHKDALERALRSIKDGIKAIEKRLPLDFIEVDIRDAWQTLGEITGDTAGEDLLDHIFENFCIGK
ncbi:MAG TPA: tRNA uridine-5-carboxymethylaminomethyl(34) synthesis GTPase MnmE [Clostridia bacterium]|nr:tRNA uridine-5-carboxymethylaminomethyl(34) synthesis GTPase MnmE [Clostridia bacterium]